MLEKNTVALRLGLSGYAKDSSSVAKEAIKHAQDQGYECVLIDTAGRMQARNCVFDR